MGEAGGLRETEGDRGERVGRVSASAPGTLSAPSQSALLVFGWAATEPGRWSYVML